MAHKNYNPERLLYLGQWAIVRQVCDIDTCRFIIFAENQADLTTYISKKKKNYIEYEVNTQPILK